jgi:hypothetical protein
MCWNGQGTNSINKKIIFFTRSWKPRPQLIQLYFKFSNTGNWRFFTIQHPWKDFHTTQALLTRTGCSLYSHKVLQGFFSLCIWKQIPLHLKMLAFTNEMDLQPFACKPSRLSNTKTFCTLHWVKACSTGPPLIFGSTAQALGSRNWKKPFVLYTGENLLHWASINFLASARGSHSRCYNCETREGTPELAFPYTNNCPTLT